MDFDRVPLIDGYRVRDTITTHSDKAIYVVEGEDDKLYVLKVFKKTYKYPLYESLSKLWHINMPQLHAVVLRDDCFYVMEDYIAGRTLREILATDGTFNRKEVVSILMQLCDVLMYLHSQIPSIIHRDITPSNIMLTDDGVVKLLDFDIAREQKSDAVADTEVVGTKPFAPPEQYGFAQSDNRTDIYSLGMLMTVMLTNTYEIKRITDLRFRRLIKRCTAFDPKKRYEDTRKLKNRLLFCQPPTALIRLPFDIDTNIYVFPNGKLRLLKILAPIAVIYFFIWGLAFVQPHPTSGDDPISTSMFVLVTLTVNPQWAADERQYIIFETIMLATPVLIMAYIAFAVYDVLRFYYLRTRQRYYLKRNTPKINVVIPFVIASKRYMYGVLSFVITAIMTMALPIVDAELRALNIQGYESDHFAGYNMLFLIMACAFCFIARNGFYPRHYNSAVRNYYKGNTAKAIKHTQKYMSRKRSPLKAWLEGLVKAT
jgi:hypothetical protein